MSESLTTIASSGVPPKPLTMDHATRVEQRAAKRRELLDKLANIVETTSDVAEDISNVANSVATASTAITAATVVVAPEVAATAAAVTAGASLVEAVATSAAGLADQAVQLFKCPKTGKVVAVFGGQMLYNHRREPTISNTTHGI